VNHRTPRWLSIVVAGSTEVGLIDILVETLQKLTARRGLLAREISTLDEAIAALQRVRDEAPKHGTVAARPGPVSVPPSTSAPMPGPPAALLPPSPRHCGTKACGKVLPPPVRPSGRPRLYCDDTCSRRAYEERKAPQSPPVSASPRQPGRGSKWAQASTAAVDDEDPTDRAIRMHKELHPVPESASGMRSRAKGRA
jgi:hypothetical protein